MSKLLVFTLALLLSLGCSLGVKQFNTEPTRVINYAQGSVVRISGVDEDSHRYACTGFVIRPQLVLTAAHCTGAEMTADGSSTFVVRKSDDTTDLALLAVATNKAPMHFRVADIARFDEVHGIGYAFGNNYLTVSFARVAAVNKAPEGDMLPGILVQPGYIKGMSGGPVIDEYGEVIGMVQQTQRGMGYGVGVLIMQAFLVGL